MEFFWEKEGWERADRHLKALTRAPFQRRILHPPLSPGVTMIRGARQVGKSTWLKSLLKEAVERGEKCFFHTCEDLRDDRDLAELLTSQKNRRVFFLDEITFVDEWWRAVKKRVDTDDSVVFVLTGSNSYDLKNGMDRMPGRWSNPGGELRLEPMLFDEWCAMREQAGWKKLPRLEALRAYMRVGGFPAALIEAGEASATPVQAKQTYLRWIQGDVVKLNRQEPFMRELLGHLAKGLGSSFSLQGLAQKTQIMSYHTAQDYLSILEHAFALRTLYAYDPDTESFRFKKEKKFYFTDPMVYWVALEWAGLKEPDEVEAQLAEMIAAEQLARKHKRLGYYSSQAGEVDFIHERDWAIEVKWSPMVTNLSKAYRNLRLPKKTVWFQGNLLEE